jgi:hypothetical protein
MYINIRKNIMYIRCTSKVRKSSVYIHRNNRDVLKKGLKKYIYMCISITSKVHLTQFRMYIRKNIMYIKIKMCIKSAYYEYANLNIIVKVL